MAEKSLFWFTDGFTGAIGDGSAPYTQQEFADRNRLTLGEGVIPFSFVASDGSLRVDGTASPLTVTEGAALVRGFHYHSDAIEDIIVATPVVNTTGGRVVLRADYDAATVRLALKLSADGVAAIPALTQIDNDIWEISLATFTATTGGVIAVSQSSKDARYAFTTLALPDRTTIDRDPKNFFQIADGGVSTAKLADDAVTAAKAGEGVPTMTNRQGGSATNWLTAGATNYTVGNVEQIIGSTNTTITTGSSSVAFTVTLPFSFAQNPFLILSLTSVSLTSKPYQVYPSPVTPPLNQLSIVVVIADGTTAPSDIDLRVSWLAIGQPA